MNRAVRCFFFALSVLYIVSCTPAGDDDPVVDNIAGTDNAAQNDDATGNDTSTDNPAATDEDQVDLPDVDMAQCAPGETDECYHGPSGSKGRGECKAGSATCGASGYWGDCIGEVLPKPEICNDGIDQNCDGEDGTEENTFDYDQDGYTYCTGDCCEFESECPHPELASPSGYDFPGNGVDDNCNGAVDEVDACDTGLGQDSTDPIDMAKSIDLCPKPADREYGLLTAAISLADGSGAPLPVQHKIFPGFGNVIAPHTGGSFLMLSSGTAGNPYTSTEEDLTQNSSAPADWYQANGSQFPSSPGCGGGEAGTEPVNDPIMLTLTAKVPMNARAFSLDIYFFSREFPEYVCEFNDFFVVLLDSAHTSSDPALQNPADKNLAMDENGNPVGINLAPAGLFRVCCQTGFDCYTDPFKNYGQYCTLGPGELAGTGLFETGSKEGGTGWLVTKGNVVAGEEITIRLAIWDTKDNVLDSMVLIDNFTWLPKEVKPGTSIQE
ncbi:MAG TPA: choice-of-anchor L domain-containing protein [bacterium]|nr:choice-of-anchor L domain-containing protein [bacterium]